MDECKPVARGQPPSDDSSVAALEGVVGGLGAELAVTAMVASLCQASMDGRVSSRDGLNKLEVFVAKCFRQGVGVPRDEENAVASFLTAAQGGSAEGQHEMGRMFFAGKAGLPQSYAEAAQYWRLAAAQGLARAEYQLGALYLKVGRCSLTVSNKPVLKAPMVSAFKTIIS